MEKSECDSYCGLYCGACDIRMSIDDNSPFTTLWTRSTLKSFLNSQGAIYNEDDLQLKCQGCKSDDLFIVCRLCKIRDCAIYKKVEHCSDCDEYPCETFKEWKKAQTFLPHISDVNDNLEAIDKIGVDEWIQDQKDHWKCPRCGKSFSWYSKNCESCGSDLTETSFKASMLKLLIWKNAIKLSSLKKK